MPISQFQKLGTSRSILLYTAAMYLRSLDVMIFDGRTNTLIATGTWKNSTFHGFYSSEKVVTDGADETLSKITKQ